MYKSIKNINNRFEFLFKYFNKQKLNNNNKTNGKIRSKSENFKKTPKQNNFVCSCSKFKGKRGLFHQETPKYGFFSVLQSRICPSKFQMTLGPDLWDYTVVLLLLCISNVSQTKRKYFYLELRIWLLSASKSCNLKDILILKHCRE